MSKWKLLFVPAVLVGALFWASAAEAHGPYRGSHGGYYGGHGGVGLHVHVGRGHLHYHGGHRVGFGGYGYQRFNTLHHFHSYPTFRSYYYSAPVVYPSYYRAPYRGYCW